ncbi:amastin-like surface protein-like protein [Trypanosoma grayi]|uniref:amastin-like surface protein-like protein n=1 Tax=Trypanosoma grayi TaxID=71804 RepID=UPI0004F49BBB|nr:amastin-like surface protein-like protein [Trypanosoma grayi]KEG10156.1 amastin-like surface protein-like protein [Trypanosoma grayi]
MCVAFSITKHLIFLILQAIVFLAVLIATPLDIYRSLFSDACYTMWGYKPDCGSETIRTRWSCKQRRDTISTAAAFAIISIFLALINSALAALSLFCKMRLSNMILFLLSMLIVLTLMVCWACIANVYNEPMCDKKRNKAIGDSYGYGVGFGLLLASWFVQILASVVSGVMVLF